MNKHFLFMLVLCMLKSGNMEDSKTVTLQLNKRSNTRRSLDDTQSSERILYNSGGSITTGVRPTIKVLNDFEELYETELLIGENKRQVYFVIDINSTYVSIDQEDNKRFLSGLDSSFQTSSQANKTSSDDLDSSGGRNLESLTADLDILNNKTLGTLTTQNVSMNGTHYWSMTVLELDNSNKQSGAKQPNVLGLSYRKAPYLVMPLLDHLWKTGLISTYSFSLNFNPSENPRIIFGDYKSSYDTRISDGTLENNSWYFKLDTSSDFYYNYPYYNVYVIISNTLSSILLTRTAFQSYMRDINTDGQWGTSDYSGNTACYWDSIDDFPTLTFEHNEGGKAITIEASNYVIKKGDIWELLVDFIEDEETWSNVIYLGYPFFRQYYTYFDKDYLYAIDYSSNDSSSSFLNNANLFMLTIILLLALIY